MGIRMGENIPDVTIRPMALAPIPEILEDLRQGKMIILVDDPKRENEGDLVCAAEKTTPEIVNFMAAQGLEGTAGAMLVIDVAVDLFGYRTLFGIDQQEHRCGAEVIVDRAVQALVLRDGETDFHDESSFGTA